MKIIVFKDPQFNSAHSGYPDQGYRDYECPTQKFSNSTLNSDLFEQNPNAPPIYPCGICHKEVHDNDQVYYTQSFFRVCV